MDFRVQAVLSAVWPTARRPLAPVVVLGIDILDALGMTSSEEASPPLVFEPEPGVVQELRGAVMIRTPPVEYEDIGRFWEVAVTGSVIFHSIAAAALAAFSIGMASRLPEKQSRKPMQLASAALALGTLREMVLVNLDKFSFVGDLALQLFNFAPDPGATVVVTHYLSDAISMPIIVAFLGTFSGEPQMVRTALHCVMPVAMFNLLAAGAVLAVTPGREVALVVGSLGSMVYFFWGLSHIEEKVPATDEDTFKEVRMSSDLLRMTMCLISLVQVGGATHCLPPEWQHHMLTVVECLFVGVCHLPLRDRAGGRVRLQSLAQ